MIAKSALSDHFSASFTSPELRHLEMELKS